MPPSERADDSALGIKLRLLPPTAFEAFVERWLERLPRQRMAARLIPGAGVTAVAGSDEDFKAESGAPGFELVLDAPRSAAGWLYIEGALVRHSGDRQARLEIYLSDDEQALVWPITTNLRGTVREVVYLPANTRRLCWFPTGSPGFFSQSALLVHRIGALESVVRRAHRVWRTLSQRERDTLPGSAQLRWWSVFTDLQQAYRAAAKLREADARGSDYSLWLARAEKAAPAQARQLAAQAARVKPATMLSLIVVLDHPNLDCLRGLVDSVVRQSYANWELLLIADGNLDGNALTILQRLRESEPRIKLHSLPGATSQAERVNHGLKNAQGTYAWLVEQHDVLHAQALVCVALEITNAPQADLVYTDSDQLDAQGQRLNPSFKPDWNPDLFLSHDYVGNALVLRRDWVRQLGGCREGVDGATVYDLVLRRLRQPGPVSIRHVPRMLYGQRMVASQQAATAHRSGLAALQAHLVPEGAKAEQGSAPGHFRIHYSLPQPVPRVCLIVPTRDRLDVLAQCVASVRAKTDYPHWEMLIVDNGSVEPATLAFLAEVTQDARIRVLRHDRPFNYSALNNFAARQTNAEILALLNNDLEVITPGWLTEMVSHALRPGVGAVGAKLLYPDGLVQHAGVVLGIGGIAGHVHKFLPADAPGYGHRAASVQNLSAVTGACLVVRAAVFREVGGMDEEHLAVAFNDIDFCLQLGRAGYRNLYTPYALFVHHESISRGRDDTPGKLAIFQRECAHMLETWGEQLRNDPAYNPNLTLESGDFSFSSPARTL